MSKIIQRTVKSRLMYHLTSNKLLNPHKSPLSSSTTPSPLFTPGLKTIYFTNRSRHGLFSSLSTDTTHSRSEQFFSAYLFLFLISFLIFLFLWLHVVFLAPASFKAHAKIAYDIVLYCIFEI